MIPAKDGSPAAPDVQLGTRPGMKLRFDKQLGFNSVPVPFFCLRVDSEGSRSRVYTALEIGGSLRHTGWDVQHELDVVSIPCPYCGELVDLLVDGSIESQHYVEDCTVCCQPIDLRVVINRRGETRIEARREDE